MPSWIASARDSLFLSNAMMSDTGESVGKDKAYPMKDFISQSHLLEYLKGISTDRADLIRFAHYMEALVAFHRYFGGKEG